MYLAVFPGLKSSEYDTVCFCVTHISQCERTHAKNRRKKKEKKERKKEKEKKRKERKKERGYEHNGYVIYVKQWDNFWPKYLCIGK